MELTHWEYSFILNTCNFDPRKARIARNPFTGETVRFPVDDGLSKDEMHAVYSVLGRCGAEGPEPEFEGYVKRGAKGDSLRFRSGGFHGHAPITNIDAELVVRELSDDWIAIVWDVARAGNFAFSSCTGTCVRIPDREPDARLLARWPDALAIRTVVELRHWIAEVIGGRRVLVLE